MTDAFAQPNTDVSGQLRDEYEAQRVLFEAQPPLVQRFLEAQARQLAETLTHPERVPQARFTLPDRVVVEVRGQPQPIPAEAREQLAGGLIDRLTRGDVRLALRQRLVELEQEPDRAVAAGAGLVGNRGRSRGTDRSVRAGRAQVLSASLGGF